MKLFIAQDWNGNVYVVDDRGAISPEMGAISAEMTDFHEVFLSEQPQHSMRVGAVLHVMIGNVSIEEEAWKVS